MRAVSCAIRRAFCSGVSASDLRRDVLRVLLGGIFLDRVFLCGVFLVDLFRTVSRGRRRFLASTELHTVVSRLRLEVLSTAVAAWSRLCPRPPFLAGPGRSSWRRGGQAAPVSAAVPTRSERSIRTRGLLTIASISESLRRKTVCSRLGSFERSQSQLLSRTDRPNSPRAYGEMKRLPRRVEPAMPMARSLQSVRIAATVLSEEVA